MQVSYIMSDEAGIHIEPERDPFHDSSAPDLKHTNLSAKYLVRAMVQVTEKEIYEFMSAGRRAAGDAD